MQIDELVNDWLQACVKNKSLNVYIFMCCFLHVTVSMRMQLGVYTLETLI